MEKLDHQPLKCTSLVVKIASRCNLNCTYCYMYNMGDESYRSQPKVMSHETIDMLIDRISEHCIEHEIKKFLIVFHGGEPLLAGKQFFNEFVTKVREKIKNVNVKFSVQTNGLLLDEDWCDLLHRLNVRIGISLDGTPEQNNKYRLDHKGRGSYDSIVEGIRIVKRSKLGKILGILCVVDSRTDPIRTYNHFKSLDVHSIDFLLPDGNYDAPPPGIDIKDNGIDRTLYADWLISVFDQWFEDGLKRVNIRMFDDIIRAILGNDINSEMLGNQNNEVLVIETNGSIESVDVLKICGNGFTKNDAHVRTTRIDDALTTDLALKYHLSHKQLCTKCNNCPISSVCGGGYLPHRYSKQNGFNNPSVYCNDLLKLITHIQNKVLDQMPKEVLLMTNVEHLNYQEAYLFNQQLD